MFGEISCLMVSGSCINNHIRNILFDTAQDMFISGSLETNFCTDRATGRVKTEQKFGIMRDIVGWIFEANVESDLGSTFVKYIAKETSYSSSEGVWVPIGETILTEN